MSALLFAFLQKKRTFTVWSKKPTSADWDFSLNCFHVLRVWWLIQATLALFLVNNLRSRTHYITVCVCYLVVKYKLSEVIQLNLCKWASHCHTTHHLYHRIECVSTMANQRSLFVIEHYYTVNLYYSLIETLERVCGGNTHHLACALTAFLILKTFTPVSIKQIDYMYMYMYELENSFMHIKREPIIYFLSINLVVIQNFIYILFTNTSKTQRRGHLLFIT